MTIAVSLRVPDGIVIATDSLMTIQTQPVPREELIQCPSCKGKIPYSLIAPPPPVIAASWSTNSQKLFCIKRRNLAIAIFGVPFLKGRSIQSYIKEFEEEVFENETVERVAQKLEQYLRQEFVEEVGGIENIAEDEFRIGFQIAGYDGKEVDIGKTFSVEVGKISRVEPLHSKGYGCSVSGDRRVVMKLWKEDPFIPIPMPPFQFLPLQDAIDYVYFLINTTIQFQRFSTMIPTCGGQIEIAVITPYSGFQWIETKGLLPL